MFDSKGKTFSQKEWNEDVFFASDSCIFVIDGATGLSNNQVMSYDDAWWFANRIKEEISYRTNYDSIVDALTEAILTVQQDYKLDVNTLLKQDMPSGCISLFREKGAQIEYLGLGDCVGLIELNDGTTEILFDDRIENMDRQVIKKMMTLSKELKIPFLETRPYVNPILLKNRNLRNQQNGFYSLDLTIDGIDGIIYKRWKKSDVKRIACISDGLYQIMEFHPDWNVSKVLDQMEENIDELFLDLYNLQEKDNQCYEVPRLKKRDDTTGVYAKIN